MTKNRLTVVLYTGIVAGLFLSAAQALEVPEAEASITINTSNLVPDDQIHVIVGDHAGNAAVLGGSVIPHKMVNLLAQWKGEVKFIAGEEGDAFKTGDKIVALDDDILQAKRQAAIAGLRSAEAGVRNAHMQYERERLSPNSQSNSMLGGAPSMFSMFNDPIRSMSGQGDPDFERHSSMYGMGIQIQTANDQVAQAKAGLAELDKNIANATVVAPFDGVIIKKMIQVGDTINPGMPLLVFADTSKMQVQVQVPTRLIRSINKGDTVMARLDRGSEPVPAVVSRIFPMASMSGHTTTVKFDLPAEVKAHAGMYAEIIIKSKNDQQSDKRPIIPESAITWRGSLPAVFKVSEDKATLKMRTIRLGSSKDGGGILVLSGLEIGDSILKSPLASTRSGPYKPRAEINAN